MILQEIANGTTDGIDARFDRFDVAADRIVRLLERPGQGMGRGPILAGVGLAVAAAVAVGILLTRRSRRPASAGAVAVCSHRPVLPSVCGSLGLPDTRLEPGEVLVAHLRAGAVVATERHGAR